MSKYDQNKNTYKEKKTAFQNHIVHCKKDNLILSKEKGIGLQNATLLLYTYFFWVEVFSPGGSRELGLHKLKKLTYKTQEA